MSGLTEMHLPAAVAAVLESWGYTADSPRLREVIPTVARGHNLVLAGPPSARDAVPALAGWVAAIAAPSPTQGAPALRALLLAPATALAEWAATLGPLAVAAGLSFERAESAARAARRLKSDEIHLLLTAPDTALALLERSALKPESVSHLFLAWPELFENQESLAPCMQELPKDAQRIVHTSHAGQVSGLVERYARKALVVGPATVEAPVGPVRAVVVPWSRRPEAIASLIETLDPAMVTLWTTDAGSAADLSAALPAGGARVQLASGSTPIAGGGLILAADLPAPDQLRALVAAGDVVLLVPPHASPYLSRSASPCRPVRLPDAASRVAGTAAARRTAVAARLEQGVADGAVLALTPLLERYDPALVAGALYQLWTEQAAQVAPAPAPAPELPGTARVWVGIGKKDNATPHDLVAALTRELGVDRGRIGKVDVRELYCLVELPAQDVPEIARRLNGMTIRRRRIVARVDQGTVKRR